MATKAKEEKNQGNRPADYKEIKKVAEMKPKEGKLKKTKAEIQKAKPKQSTKQSIGKLQVDDQKANTKTKKLKKEERGIRVISEPKNNWFVDKFRNISFNFRKQRPNVTIPHSSLHEYKKIKPDFVLNGVRSGEIVLMHEPESIKGEYLKELFCKKEHHLNIKNQKVLFISTVEPLSSISDVYDGTTAYHDVEYTKKTIADIYNGEKDLHTNIKSQMAEYDLLVIDNWEKTTLMFDDTGEDNSVRSYIKPMVKAAQQANTAVILVINGDFVERYKEDPISLMEMSFQNTIEIKEKSTGSYEANFMRRP